jgi:hypothetical protein
MPSFKPKSSKKVIKEKCNANISLDHKHQEKIQEIEYNSNELLPKLNEEKNEIVEVIKNNEFPIDEKLELKDKLKHLNTKILHITKERDEYYLNNSTYIFDYFEDKKQIAEGNNEVGLIEDFFNVKKNKKEKKQIDTKLHKYLSNINDDYIDLGDFVKSVDVCQKCNKGELIPVEDEGLLVCNNCGIHKTYLVENEKPSYKDPPKEVCFYAYKRINHFREILAQFQAKETTQIPDDVFENIKIQYKKERLSLKQLEDNNNVKDILKKLGYNKYYEHIPFIKDKLGIKPPVMKVELEETLCNLFMEIQNSYAKFCPDNRVNFLNYYYTLYKLCELLEQDKFLSFFPMLKDPEKRIEQDNIWKQICNDLRWEFIPTK